jgi:hypothetical protein
MMSGPAVVQTQVIARPAITPITSGMVQRQCACGQHSGNGGECEECERKREGTLQRTAINPAPGHEVPPIVHEVLRSPGQPLDRTTRSFMEPRFGHDFSRIPSHSNAVRSASPRLVIGEAHDAFEQEAERMAQLATSHSVAPSDTRYDLSGVRIHTDDKAAASARAVNALAYTVGRDVVFGAGQYQPATRAGRSLLAHELTHVVQQQTDATRSRHVMRKEPQDTPPKTPAPADKVNECEPARALTWGDYSDKVPKDATVEANTGTRIKLIQANGSDMFQCTLDAANVWAMPQAKNAADNAKNGCQEKIQACEDWITKNPGKTVHNDPPAQRKCPASIIPKRVESKTKKECATVFGQECKRAQVADAALLLKHEQLHFTISCIMVNKANQALKAGKDFDAITKNLDAKWRKLNADYDTETKNRCDQTKQDEWQKKVDKGLPGETIP